MSLPAIVIAAMAVYSTYTAIQAIKSGEWGKAILAGIGAFAGFSAVTAASAGSAAGAGVNASQGLNAAGANSSLGPSAVLSKSGTIAAPGAAGSGVGAGGIPIAADVSLDGINAAASAPPVDALLSTPTIMADTAGVGGSLIDSVSSAIGQGAENLVEWGTNLVKDITTGDIFDRLGNLVSSGTDTSGGGLLGSLGGAKGLAGAAVQGYGQHQQTKSLEKSRADSLAAQEKRRKMKSTFVATPDNWGQPTTAGAVPS